MNRLKTLSNSTLLLMLPALVTAQTAEYPAVDCVVQPFRLVDIGSPVAGILNEVLVDRSDFVEPGDTVARLDDSIEAATVELARARARIDAQLEAELVNVKYDQKSQERVTSLYGRRVIPVENKDAADRDAQLSQLRLQQVRDLQLVRNLELARASTLVEQKVIRSPIEGFVVTRFKSEGEFVEDQPIVRVAQLNPLSIEAIVPMKYFGLIKPGMAAEVSPEMVNAGLRRARVTVVDRVGDAASSSFGVRLEMDNEGFEVPAGLKCEVKFLPDMMETRFVNHASGQASDRQSNDAADYDTAARPIDTGRMVLSTESIETGSVGSPVLEPMVESTAPPRKDQAGEAERRQLLAAHLTRDVRQRTEDLTGQGAQPVIDGIDDSVAKIEPQHSSADSAGIDYSLGPFDSEESLQQALKKLQDQNVTTRSESIAEFVSYVVVTTSDDSRAVRLELQAAGVEDYSYMPAPPYRGRYSLGIYNGIRHATLRVEALRELGISAEVRERTRQRTAWWLDVKPQPGDNISNELAQRAPAAFVQADTKAPDHEEALV